MRKRQSQGSVERYGVTLSSTEPDEHQVIETLGRLPRGRRQQWIRKLLLLGVQNQRAFIPRQDRLPWVGDGSDSKKILSLALDRGISEEALVLEAIEKLPLIRRGSAIRGFLSIGVFFDQKNVFPAFQESSKIISSDTFSTESARKQKTPEVRLKAPEKREKVVQKSSKPKVASSLTVNMGDNRLVDTAVDVPPVEPISDNRKDAESEPVEVVSRVSNAEDVVPHVAVAPTQVAEKSPDTSVNPGVPSSLSRMRKLFEN